MANGGVAKQPNVARKKDTGCVLEQILGDKLLIYSEQVVIIKKLAE